MSYNAAERCTVHIVFVCCPVMMPQFLYLKNDSACMRCMALHSSRLFFFLYVRGKTRTCTHTKKCLCSSHCCAKSSYFIQDPPCTKWSGYLYI